MSIHRSDDLQWNSKWKDQPEALGLEAPCATVTNPKVLSIAKKKMVISKQSEKLRNAKNTLKYSENRNRKLDATLFIHCQVSKLRIRCKCLFFSYISKSDFRHAQLEIQLYVLATNVYL